ncbi:HIT family protein [candidate division WOR-3 bacterium]|nr:HIT family protein [candidate division WOR-3 bacterium]
MKDCIFCKIINGELPCSKVYEDDDFLAFMDIQPVNKGHVLVIPKIHKESIVDLDDNLVKKLIIVGNKINKAIRKSDIKSDGVNFFLADGEAAGQEVFHVHLHLIPRFEKDGFGFTFPEGYVDKPERDELEQIAQKIKSNV